MGEQVPWPLPPRETGPWNGGPPVAPPGNTALPPLPGASGTMGGTAAVANPWTQQQPVPAVNIPPERRGAPGGGPIPGPPPAPPGAPAQPLGPSISDRAPIWLLVLAVLVVLAMVAGVAYLVLKGGRQYPSAWDPRVADIADWVAEERELDFEHPVTVNFLTDEEYTARATAGGDISDPENAAYYEDQAAQLRALGFISGKVDLSAANDALSDSGTLAYYDPDVEQVFVRGTDLSPALRVTLAHELTHVLQDQHFDLNRLGDLEDGRAAVLRALGEGDAGRIEDAYVADVLTEEERAAYDEESQAGSDDATAELDEKVPPILTTLFAAPYILGPELISVLDATDGNKAIDGALLDPPTEEALFDPRTFGTKALDPQGTTIEAPDGAEPIDGGEFGPTTWYLMLAARMSPEVALEATDGWGGDAYVVYREDDQVCVSISYRGDTADDVTQMHTALEAWVAKSPEGSASVEGDDVLTFKSCDPGEAAEGAGEVSPTLLGLPVTRTQVYGSVIEGDGDPDDASCFAQGVVERFTFEQITDPQGAFVSSDPGQQIMSELRQGCFGG